LCRPDRSVVEISAAGWRIISDPPVYFRRPAGLKALPMPTRGGNLERLRTLLNLKDDQSWRLVVGWSLAAMWPRPPFPVLVLTGEHGSAKSTTAKILRQVIDPTDALLRSMPRKYDDLAVAAHNSWILAFDNMSMIQPGMSDMFCQVSTGGTFTTRRFYVNLEE